MTQSYAEFRDSPAGPSTRTLMQYMKPGRRNLRRHRRIAFWTHLQRLSKASRRWMGFGLALAAGLAGAGAEPCQPAGEIAAHGRQSRRRVPAAQLEGVFFEIVQLAAAVRVLGVEPARIAHRPIGDLAGGQGFDQQRAVLPLLWIEGQREQR